MVVEVLHILCLVLLSTCEQGSGDIVLGNTRARVVKAGADELYMGESLSLANNLVTSVNAGVAWPSILSVA